LNLKYNYYFLIYFFISLFSLNKVYSQTVYITACSLGGVYRIAEVDIPNKTIKIILTIPNGFIISDITMDKSGTFYLTDHRHLLKVVPVQNPLPPPNWNYVSYDTLCTFPTSPGLGNIVSLAIDCDENIFAGDVDSKEIYSYNIHTGEFISYGKYEAEFFDFEFFNGELHALCYNYPRDTTVKLRRIHLDDLSLVDSLTSVFLPNPASRSYGMANYIGGCSSSNLFSLRSGNVIKFDSSGRSYELIDFPNMCQGGATSATSWIGSLSPLALDSVEIEPLLSGCTSLFDITIYPKIGRCERPGTEFSLDGVLYQQNNLFHNIPPGAYLPYIRDSLGCVVQGDTLFLQQATLEHSSSIIPEYCNLHNGEIHITGNTSMLFAPEGGTFSRSTLLLSGLDSGDYAILRKNDTGCLDTISLTVPDIPAFTFSHRMIPDTCGRAKGQIEILTSGAQGSTSLSIDGLQFDDTDTLNSLMAGSYVVYIRDSVGCVQQANISVAAIAGPRIDSLSLTPPQCNTADGRLIIHATGHTERYQLNGLVQRTNVFSGLSSGNYTISVIDSNGCSTDTTLQLSGSNVTRIDSVSIRQAHCDAANGQIDLHIDGGEPVLISIDSVDFTLGSRLSDLAAGDYVVYIRNTQGCISLIPAHIEQTGVPRLSQLLISPATCDSINGTVIVSASGHAPLNYTLSGIGSGTEGQFDHLAPGDYTLSVTDSYSCVIDSTFHLDSRHSAAVIAFTTQSVDCGASYGILSLNGDSDMRYLIRESGRIASAGDTLHLTAGQYHMTISNVDCTRDTLITIPAGDCPFYIPNVFTPNHDGVNDLFRPEGQIEILSMLIYDRWGGCLYSGNGPEAAWDGRFNGRDLQPGVYVYSLRLRKPDGSEVTAKGSVTLIR